EPTSFRPEAGKIIGVRLKVGQDFLGDPLPRDSALIDQFITLDSSGRMPVVGHDGGDPAGLVRVATPWLRIIGSRSRPCPVVMSVHMIPAPESARAEWASEWASLTFELMPARSGGAAK